MTSYVHSNLSGSTQHTYERTHYYIKTGCSCHVMVATGVLKSHAKCVYRAS